MHDDVLVAAGADADHADPRPGQLLEPPDVGLRGRRQLVDRREQVTRARLAGIAAYADGIGARKDLLLREGLGRRLVRRAHREWLTVHAWTLRAENRFLGRAFRSGEGGRRHGDLAAETRHLLDLGVDGLITDHPDLAIRAREELVAV